MRMVAPASTHAWNGFMFAPLDGAQASCRENDTRGVADLPRSDGHKRKLQLACLMGDSPGSLEAAYTALISSILQRTIASPTSTTIPKIAAAMRKNTANRAMEMRLATTDALVRPSAPAISEMMRKMMANLSMGAVLVGSAR